VKAAEVGSKERTDAVALRAALESAVQLGRRDEVNRQAEMANSTKCRDSLQRRVAGFLIRTCHAYTAVPSHIRVLDYAIKDSDMVIRRVRARRAIDKVTWCSLLRSFSRFVYTLECLSMCTDG
jgi:hypothetical protein